VTVPDVLGFFALSFQVRSSFDGSLEIREVDTAAQDQRAGSSIGI
jgi:hypothetical protein